MKSDNNNETSRFFLPMRMRYVIHYGFVIGILQKLSNDHLHLNNEKKNNVIYYKGFKS